MECPKYYSLNFEVVPVSFLLVLFLILMIFQFIHKCQTSAKKHDINTMPPLHSHTSFRLIITTFAPMSSVLYDSLKEVEIPDG